MESRPFADGELRLLLELAQELRRTAPAAMSCDFGQIAFWAANMAHGEHRVRLWYDDGGRLAGWGWLTREIELEWQVRPEQPELLDSILDWAQPSEVLVRADHTDAIARLRAHGLQPEPGGAWMRVNERALDRIEEPQAPTGYQLRTVRGSRLRVARGRAPVGVRAVTVSRRRLRERPRVLAIPPGSRLRRRGTGWLDRRVLARVARRGERRR